MEKSWYKWKRVDIVRIGNQYKSIGNGDQEAIAETIEKDLRSLRW